MNLCFSRVDSPPYDGLTELWWDSIEDFLASFNTPEGIEATKQYIAESRPFLAEEYVVFDFTSEPA